MVTMGGAAGEGAAQGAGDGGRGGGADALAQGALPGPVEAVGGGESHYPRLLPLRPTRLRIELLDVIQAYSPLTDFLAIFIDNGTWPDRFPWRGRIEFMRKLVHEDQLVLDIDVAVASVQWPYFNKISS